MTQPAPPKPGGKTALLAELLGPDRLKKLRASGVLPEDRSGAADPATLNKYRARLLAKLRQTGLLAGQTADPEASANATAAPPARADDGGSLHARLAAHLDPDRLCDEHPAVIAILLGPLAPQMRSGVLRRLPGAQARAVMRHLRSNQAQSATQRQAARARRRTARP